MQLLQLKRGAKKSLDPTSMIMYWPVSVAARHILSPSVSSRAPGREETQTWDSSETSIFGRQVDAEQSDTF